MKLAAQLTILSFRVKPLKTVQLLKVRQLNLVQATVQSARASRKALSALEEMFKTSTNRSMTA